MLKKMFVLCLVMSCVMGCCANAFELDKKLIRKEFKCKTEETIQHAQDSIGVAFVKKDHIYENETFKIETFVACGFDNLILNTASKNYLSKSSTVVLVAGGNDLLGYNTWILISPWLMFRITNKTEKPLEFDIDHSQISLGSYQGRGVQAGTKYNGAATSMQPPVMIFPKSTKDVTLWRQDHNFYEAYYLQGRPIIPSKWMPPFDVSPDKNLLGDMILCINKKYITFSPKAYIDGSKLKWVKKK